MFSYEIFTILEFFYNFFNVTSEDDTHSQI